jgi:hypothetical protein
MEKVKIRELEVGAILATDVKDMSGRLLLSAGSEIAEKHLNIFKIWGVIEVEITSSGELVQSQADVDLSDVDPEILKQVEQNLDKLFLHNDRSHPVMQELISYVKEVKLRKLIAS